MYFYVINNRARKHVLHFVVQSPLESETLVPILVIYTNQRFAHRITQHYLIGLQDSPKCRTDFEIPGIKTKHFIKTHSTAVVWLQAGLGGVCRFLCLARVYG